MSDASSCLHDDIKHSVLVLMQGVHDRDGMGGKRDKGGGSS